MISQQQVWRTRRLSSAARLCWSNGTCDPTAKGTALTARTMAPRFFEIKDSFALRVTLQSVGPQLQQGDLILIVLHSHGNITPACETKSAVIIKARETIGNVVDRAVNLAEIK